eukprot:c13042_g1_i1.p3 GENE.c13042_g1_i1~~c13042_g1_i1.p3  ORF type:complete len:266 (+),score=-65.11 c13042_g1_i1:3501-4298(+)
MSKKVFKENPCPSCGAWDFSTNYTMDRFNKHFEEIVRYDILYKDRFTNVMQIPKINKIFVNTGIGKKAVLDNKHIFTALLAIELITGQKPIVTRAKKWVDKFQLKKNMPIGCKVTLRHKNMNQFLDRLINRVLPRIEDFMGHNSVGGGVFSRPQSSMAGRDRDLRSLPLATNGVQSNGRSGGVAAAPLFKWQQNEKRPQAPQASQALGSTSFGIGEKDFLTFSEIQYDQFDTLYGLDIIIVFSPIKNRYLSQPKYLLSAFQMPLC